MTNRLTPIDPDVGLAWVDESLASGGSLAQRVRDVVDLPRGSVRAALPAGEDADHPERGFGARDASTALLFAFLRESHDADAYLVVEDELLRRGDHEDVRKFGTPVVFCDDEVLHVQRLSAFDAGVALEKFFNWSSAGHPLNAFLIRAGTLAAASVNGTVDQATLEQAAQQVELLIVGAYDADGFLVWSPRS
jgi:hypothetical protein